MMTNFQKVQEFNTAFDVNRICITKDSFESNENHIMFRLSLIEEEFRELKDGINKKDKTEIRDALADILYVVYGMADTLGINADLDFDIVHKSNMSKLCTSEEEALETVNDYKYKYERGLSPYDTPYYYYFDKIGKWVVKNKSTGKVLKSINYTEANFNYEYF